MIRIVRLEFKPEHTIDFNDLFESRKERIRNVPGCTYLALWQDHHHSNVFYTYSLWQAAIDLENYRSSDFFKDTWATIKPWFKAPAQAFSTHAIDELA